jgi:hypothetical protein
MPIYEGFFGRKTTQCYQEIDMKLSNLNTKFQLPNMSPKYIKFSNLKKIPF